jgi:PAS domain S-box-containing protein
MIVLFILLGWYFVTQQIQALTQTTIAAYQQTELEIVRTMARSVENYLADQAPVSGNPKIVELEQEILERFIAPVQLLRSGDAWIYTPDHVVFDRSSDFPESYQDKNIAEIFTMQAQAGASHYEEMVEAVMKGREGVGWYIWLPDKGQEIAAWTSVSVGDFTWVIGLSTPLPEILESTGAATQIRNSILIMGLTTLVLLGLLIAWGRSATLRGRAEKAFQESETRFRHVISSISDHIYVTELIKGGEGINHYVSPNVEPLTGYPPEKFQSDWSFWQSLIHPDDKTQAAVQLAQFARGQGSEVEYRLTRVDGQVIWVRDSGQVEKDTQGQTIMVYGVVSDITERKRAEAALALARDQALETSRLRSQLLANVSHDLRTPLTTIQGYAQLLEMGAHGPITDKQAQTIAAIIESAKYLTSLVNDLLDQAKLEDGKLKLNITTFMPADVVNQVQSNMSVPAHTKGLTLITDIAPEVPLTVSGDPDRVQQILVNLVNNAIKFTQQGTVHVRLFRPNVTHWALQVSDTGIGILEKDQSHIFEPFRQLENGITQNQPGSGLGLSIVKQLTHLMGGYITLKSEVGQGSAFTVFLPLSSAQEKEKLTISEDDDC